ncbi:MAG: ABC transporter permease [Gammaproteobacteria bacterium]|jgi:putative ABC transport system permease protein|nr:ABC transporter permease [Gammaproteobacteria bacterium]
MTMLSLWVKDAYALFCYYKTRFILSLVGIVIGVGSICALMALNNIVESNSREFLKKFGGSRFVLTVIPSSPLTRKVADKKLSSEEVRTFCQQYQQEFMIAPYQLLNGKSSFNFKTLDSIMLATTPEMFTLMQWPLESGRYLHPLDMNDKVAVIGSFLAEKLKERGVNNILGMMVNIEGHYFSIIGVLKEIEFNPLLDFDPNHSLFIDLNFLNRFKSKNFIDSFIIQGMNQDLMSSENTIKERFTIDLEKMRLFFRDALLFQKALFKQVTLTMNILALVAVITLFLGALSIVNLLLVLIDERKKEVGLRLALGATSLHIWGQFLVETMCLCIVGGLGGIVFGQITAYIIVRKLEITYYCDWSSWLIGLPISLLLGLVVGMIPARLAVKHHPVKLLNS